MSHVPDRRSLRRTIDGLAIFHDVLDDPVGRAAKTLMVEPAQAPAARLLSALAEEAELYPEAPVGDAWQNHLLDRVLASDNIYSRKAERAGPSEIGDRLLNQVRRELGLLQYLYWEGGAVVAAEAFAALGDDTRPSWTDHRPLGGGPALHTPEAISFKRDLGASTNWPSYLERLALTYAATGVGDFGRFRAFRWIHESEKGHLEGIDHPDPIRLEDLFTYEREQEPAVRNAERFAAGLPANNVLIYGESGTGKSSTVKALLNAFGDRGLRLIDVPKEALFDLFQILALVRDRKQRFLLFVDDLSFEENETWYKPLKALLEGSIEARPENVVVYATSNRRHVVRERFSDREEAFSTDVHELDTMDEKLSLSDRFGLRVWFGGPDQDRYLKIVSALADSRQISLPGDQLKERALMWAERHNARSGRTARQFIDALTGELALP
ncbi:MAG: ATP-binding protein [Chloroflexi bacterium]|nr:ATP-binding protein [Chloroflexota bacterium]